MLVNWQAPDKVYLVCGKTDLRKGIDGLAMVIAENYGLELYSNSLFLFCGSRNDRFKALFWDGEGFILLYKCFENGQVPLSNNAVEQTIRPSTLIRKNCLFAKSTAGAEANAVFYTLVATAKMNQLNPYRYFKYLFEELPNRKTVSLEAYLPWAKVIQENCHQ